MNFNVQMGNFGLNSRILIVVLISSEAEKDVALASRPKYKIPLKEYGIPTTEP